jgi:murein L,D-transpeptidase YcbB/YkuD
VVVGKAMRTQTPIFTRDMTFIVLRPYWNVPPGTLRRSVIPAISRDRSEVYEEELRDNVKLMFPNEYSVYLHSTPSTELFSRSRRDFSAGCIRKKRHSC